MARCHSLVLKGPINTNKPNQSYGELDEKWFLCMSCAGCISFHWKRCWLVLPFYHFYCLCAVTHWHCNYSHYTAVLWVCDCWLTGVCLCRWVNCHTQRWNVTVDCYRRLWLQFYEKPLHSDTWRHCTVVSSCSQTSHFSHSHSVLQSQLFMLVTFNLQIILPWALFTKMCGRCCDCHVVITSSSSLLRRRVIITWS